MTHFARVQDGNTYVWNEQEQQRGLFITKPITEE